MCLTFQRLSKMEARAHNAEYRAFALNEADQTALIGCNASTTIGETDPQHFISLNLSADSRYHVALLAFTAAGCNASLSNNTIFIPTQKEGNVFMCTTSICKQVGNFVTDLLQKRF